MTLLEASEWYSVHYTTCIIAILELSAFRDS